jgi:carbamoyltransferase
MAEIILGISAYFHDSAAVLLVDGELVAAAQEERFSRIKNDASFPARAIQYVLDEAGLNGDEVQCVTFYEKPLLKFERLLETYHAFAPSGIQSFLKAMPLWMKEKIFFRRNTTKELEELGIGNASLLFPEHHLSHAASAFYPSPFEEAAILTIDGAGEWANMTMGKGSGNSIRVLKEQHFPHSLGLLYSAFTYYLGFEVNGGEYKLMGLAAYGNKNAEQTKDFIEKITRHIIDIREDGSVLLKMNFFRFATHLTMTNDAEWRRLFQLERREPDDPLLQVHANLACAIQQVLERVVIRLAKTTLALAESSNLVMAGGVALNSVINGTLIDLPELNELWIQPAAGDAGGALGAAYAAWHIGQDEPRKPRTPDSMQGAYLGPSYTNTHINALSKKHPGLPFRRIEKEADLLDETVEHLVSGKVVGWFQDRMEFGPRALGNRSILADPRKPDMQTKINQKIKFRESFRPFAPSVMQEDAYTYFDIETTSPYMLLVRPVQDDRRTTAAEPDASEIPIMERLSHVRSDIPSVTHVDYSARIQTVHKETNPRYWKLLNCFKAETGYGLLINTSFNVKDEPIVCSPDEAIRCFQKTDMDMLVLNDFVVLKR